jgi:hypothetical protein
LLMIETDLKKRAALHRLQDCASDKGA